MPYGAVTHSMCHNVSVALTSIAVYMVGVKSETVSHNCVCVCVCVSARVHVCSVCVCVCACVCVCVTGAKLRDEMSYYFLTLSLTTASRGYIQPKVI